MSTALVMMIPWSLSLALLCALNIWTIHAMDCGDRQTEINGRCCDMCPPGQYMKAFCSENQKTVCSPCQEGSFNDRYNVFPACKECRSCKQDYAVKCTPTTNTNCSCHAGFLCSNHVCSICEENKCVMGEKVKRKVNSSTKFLTKYSYQCEPACPDNEYFDVKADACKPRIQCSMFGLTEKFPGNKTHNSVCEERSRNGGDFLHVILGIGFVLLSLTLLVLLSYACIKNLKKRTPSTDDYPIHTKAVSVTTSDFHLSKEESGIQLIIQDESKNSDSLGPLHLAKISAI